MCILLTAASHCGEIERAQCLWREHIQSDAELSAHRKVNTAWIDCLARKGRLRSAYRHLREYEHRLHKHGSDVDTSPAWMALLGGCRKHQKQKHREYCVGSKDIVAQRNHDNIDASFLRQCISTRPIL